MNQRAAAVTLGTAPPRARVALLLSLAAHAFVISLSAVARLEHERGAEGHHDELASDRWVGSTFLFAGEPSAGANAQGLVEVELSAGDAPAANEAPAPSPAPAAPSPAAPDPEAPQPAPSAPSAPSSAASVAPATSSAPSAPSTPSTPSTAASATPARPSKPTRRATPPAPSTSSASPPSPGAASAPPPPVKPKPSASSAGDGARARATPGDGAKAPTPSSAGEGGEGGERGSSGAEGEEERQKRDLGRAFARALPIANQADAAWGKASPGRLGPIRVVFEIDGEGALTGHTVSTEGAPAALVELVKRTTFLVQRGVFAVRGTMKAGREVLELSAEVLDVAVEVEGGGASVAHRWSGDAGEASFTQTSGRRVVVSVKRVSP